MASSPTFDPFSQNITFISPDGPVNVSLVDIDDFNLYNVEICINYGSQIGASIATLLILLLLSKPDKRLSTIMILNTLSLIFNIIRNVLQCVFFTGPFAEVYASFTADYSRVRPGNIALSVTATVFTLLLQVSVEASLYLQVRVVCVTLRKVYRQLISAASAIIVLLAIGFRFAYTVKNDQYIVAEESPESLYMLGSASNITTCISLFWFCAVFVIKLGYALHQRRKMGLGQFGPMQILMIMGFQTLIIPAVLSILQYWVSLPAMSSNALTACAIFLPLSSLWASASIDNRSAAMKPYRKGIADMPSGFTNPSTLRQTSTGPVSSTVTAVSTRSSGGGVWPTSPKQLGENGVSDDLEKQGLADSRDVFKGSA